MISSGLMQLVMFATIECTERTMPQQLVSSFYINKGHFYEILLDVSKHRNKYNRYKGGGVGGGGYR